MLKLEYMLKSIYHNTKYALENQIIRNIRLISN